MFRPQQKPEASPQRATRLKLNPIAKPPTLDDIKVMFGEAEKTRGVMIELAIRRDMPPVFILTCQYDANAPAPLWSLYEGEDGSKVVWAYPNANLDMITEIIFMSMPLGTTTVIGGKPSSEVPAPAKPAAPPPPPSSPAGHQTGQQPMPTNPYAAPAGAPPGTPHPGGSPQPGGPNTQQQQGMPYGGGYPGQQPYGNAPNPTMPPGPSYPATPGQQSVPPGTPPGYPGGPAGYPQAPNQNHPAPGFGPASGTAAPYGGPVPPQQGYPGQSPQPGWGQPAAPYPPGTPAPQPGLPYNAPGAVPHPSQGHQPTPQAPSTFYNNPAYSQPGSQQMHGAPQSGFPGGAGGGMSNGAANDLKPVDMNGFIDILSKGQPNLLLGHLFIEAGLLPEPCVEAALRVQELIRKGQLSGQAAVESLRIAAERGGVLDDETLQRCRQMYPLTPESSPRAANAGQSLDPREAARQVIMMIQNSGIVSDNDISTAEAVRRKHGGDVASILIAAGKVERETVEAARSCHNLVRDCRLNTDEVVKILRHCQKNRSSIQDACRELQIRIL